MFDPGVSLKSTTLEGAWKLLETGKTGVRDELSPRDNSSLTPVLTPVLQEATDAIEAMAVPAGLRSRRVLLDAGWWRHAGRPMIARVLDRRRGRPRAPPLSWPSPRAGARRGSL